MIKFLHYAVDTLPDRKGETSVATDQKEERKIFSDLTNWFLHGFMLFIISYIVFLSQMNSPIWMFSVFVVYGVTIYAVLLIVIGIVNMIITELLWPITMRGNSENWIIQGLFIILPTQILLLLSIPILQFISTFPQILVLISALLVFFGYIFVFGFIGVSVARMFSDVVVDKQDKKKKDRPLINGTRGRCSFCGESYRYPMKDISVERTVRCLNCGHTFYLEPDEELLKKLGEYSEKNARIDL